MTDKINLIVNPKLKEELRTAMKGEFEHLSELIRGLGNWYISIRHRGLFLRDINEMLLTPKEETS